MWNIIHLMKTINNISTQLRKGVLEFFVLATLRNQSKYPREIIEELNAYGLNLVEGTIYPLFLRLVKQNLVQYEWVEAAGHPRKYYCLTSDGITALENYKNEWTLLNKVLDKIM